MDASDANQAEIITQLRELGAGIQELHSEGFRDGHFNGGRGGSSGSNGSRSGEIHREPRGRKLEIPSFSGQNAFAWLSKVERYFQINEVAEDEKVAAAMLVLDGEAMSWYQWWELSNVAASSVVFRREMLSRFQPETLDNPYGPWLLNRDTNRESLG